MSSSSPSPFAAIPSIDGLLGRDEEAISLLVKLVDRGWANLTVMEGSPLHNVARDPRFQPLLQRVRQAAAAPSG